MAALEKAGAALIFAWFVAWPLGLSWYIGRDVDFWWQQWKSEKERRQYLFDGANNRGYLDLCEKAGVLGVWFRDECPSRPSTQKEG